MELLIIYLTGRKYTHTFGVLSLSGKTDRIDEIVRLFQAYPVLDYGCHTFGFNSIS